MFLFMFMFMFLCISMDSTLQAKREKFTGEEHVETGRRGSVEFVLPAIVERQ